MVISTDDSECIGAHAKRLRSETANITISTPFDGDMFYEIVTKQLLPDIYEKMADFDVSLYRWMARALM